MELVTEPAVLVLVGSFRSAGMFACSLLLRLLLPAGRGVWRQGQPHAWHGVSSCCSCTRHSTCSFHMSKQPTHGSPPHLSSAGRAHQRSGQLHRPQPDAHHEAGGGGCGRCSTAVTVQLRPAWQNCYSADAACRAELSQLRMHARCCRRGGSQGAHHCLAGAAAHLPCPMHRPHSHPSRPHRWPAVAAL